MSIHDERIKFLTEQKKFWDEISWKRGNENKAGVCDAMRVIACLKEIIRNEQVLANDNL